MAAAKTQPHPRRQRLLTLLADGGFHSGEKLAKRLRISRGGVWKGIHALQAMGIDVESVPRQGYRLPRAVDLLDKAVILGSMPSAAREKVERLDVLLSVDSTNRHIAESPDVSPSHVQVCVAELQNAG